MKKTLLVGGSGGLGQELAKALTAQKCKIVNLSRTSTPYENISLDLTKDNSIEAATKKVLNDHSDADCLIFCPGVMHWHAVGEIPIEEIDDDFAVNITGTIKLTNQLLPVIKKNKGDVVFIGSSSSFVSYGNDAVYTAAKHAVLGFAKSLQVECKKEDVRILGIYPGGFQGPFHVKAKSALKQEELMHPKDIAEMILTSLALPRNIEVSQLILTRKKPN